MARFGRAQVLLAPLLLAALSGCDGGGSSGSSSAPTAGTGGGIVTPVPAPSPSPAAFTDGDAARLAKQATFGPTPELIARIKSVGVDAWLDEQFAATGSDYADLRDNPVNSKFCASGDTACNRQHFTRAPVAMRFYANAISGNDQLRQRVAFALSQLFVTSEAENSRAAGIAGFQQIMLDKAFGNFRAILVDVSMHCYMGDYLDMAGSRKNAPSENYAREFLQLFTMGPDQLNIDGTPRLDATGARIPNYTSEDIRGIARALTGWTCAKMPNSNEPHYGAPMTVARAYYDTDEKQFLGTTVAAGVDMGPAMTAVLDAAFNHSSTPPYIARFLIQHLVTANPTPAYVARVANAFVNNGAGVRGDMKAVIRAILIDSEARSAANASVGGKLKEPVLLMTALARAIGVTTDGYTFYSRDIGLGQPVFRAPSVFNFYPPDYPLPGSATLKSPVSKLMNTSNVLRWHNVVHDWTVGGDETRAEFTADSLLPLATGTKPAWSGWEALGTDTDAMIARINLLLLANSMTDAQKAALKRAAEAITNADANLQARRRAQTMLYLVASSPLYWVDR